MKTWSYWLDNYSNNPERPDAKWIESIQSDAEQSGYQRGFNEGRKQGMKEAHDIVESLPVSSGIAVREITAHEQAMRAILEAMNKLP